MPATTPMPASSTMTWRSMGLSRHPEGRAAYRGFFHRHGRARPGHRRLACRQAAKTWMPGTRPGMTSWGRRLRSHRAHFKFQYVSHERLDAGLGAAEDERVDVVRALVGVHGLEVLRHADDVILLGDAVAAVHVACRPGDVERLAAVVALHQRDRRRRGAALLQHAAEPQRALLRQPNGPARPLAFGSRFSSGTTQSASTISPVIEARSDSLPSIFGVAKPFMPRSTTKPRMTPSSLAQTTAMSATGALEIQVLAPLSL